MNLMPYRLGRLVTTLGIGVALGLGTAHISHAYEDILTEDLLVLNELNKAQTQQQTANNQAHVTPRQSTAPAITHDKLVLNHPIIDKAHILSDGEKSHLETQLRRIYDDGLAQMAVVIVPTTDGVDIFEYAYQVAERWGLGQKDSDDGILMVVAINDRKLHIVTGYGVEGVLPDVVLKRIIREDITPSFKTGEYAQGLSAGIARIDERLRADPETLARADNTTQATSFDDNWIFVPAFVLGLFLAITFGRLLGASVATVGFVVVGSSMGLPFAGLLLTGLFLWILILVFASPSAGGASGHHGSIGRSRGGNSFGGGFGSGGFGGGGGSFGGGGAGGSW